MKEELKLKHTIYLKESDYKEVVGTKHSLELETDYFKRVFSLGRFMIVEGYAKKTKLRYLPKSEKIDGRVIRIDITHNPDSRESHAYFEENICKGARACFIAAFSATKKAPKKLEITFPRDILKIARKKVKGKVSRAFFLDDFLAELYPFCDSRVARKLIYQLYLNGQVDFAQKLKTGHTRPSIKANDGSTIRPSHLIVR
jgi:hypothetical protein